MKRGILLFFSLLLASSCAAFDRSPDRDDLRTSLLTYVSESDRAQIQEVRSNRARVAEDLRIAKSDLSQVQSRLELARNDLDNVDRRIDEADNRIEYASRYGNQSELENARQMRDEASNAMRYAQGKIRYYEDLEELARDLVDLHENRLELANASVDLEEAEAVARLNRPAAQDVDVAYYRRRVAELQDDVAMDDVQARSSRIRVALRRQFLEGRAEAVPASFRLGELEPADTVLNLPTVNGGQWGLPSEAYNGGQGWQQSSEQPFWPPFQSPVQQERDRQQQQRQQKEQQQPPRNQ